VDGVELSKELLDELGEYSGGTVIAAAKKKKGKKKKKKQKAEFDETNEPVERPHNALPSFKRQNRNAEAYFETKRATKRERKRLAKVEEDKLRKERRKQLLESLSANQLSAQEQQLLKSTSKIGTKETTQDRLRDELLRERAGLVNNSVVEGKVEDSSKGDEEPVKKRRKVAKPSKRSAGAKLIAVAQSESDESSDSENEIMEQVDVVKEPANDVKEPATPVVKASTTLVADEKTTDVVRVEAAAQPVPRKTEEERFVVRVNRAPQVQSSRQELPVCMMEQEIMEKIETNAVTVLCGETGSGKTTQVPQFLFEAGYGCPDSPDAFRRGLVGVTQPRRVATVSMARRVGHELGIYRDDSDIKGTVGYQIRYDAHTISENNRLKFMTDGVLLREAREDLLLRKYSCIIIDEAHERNLNTDILLGILSRVVPLREQIAKEGSMKDVFPLRVIIMSATLRVDDFAKNPQLFVENPPPVVNVQARQFPVSVHFSRRTEMRNYLEATFKKVCAIHRRLPAGGILVFLTGQREIEWMVQSLQKKFRKAKPKVVKKKQEVVDEEKANEEEEEIDYSDIDSESENENDEDDDQEVDESKASSLAVAAKDRIKSASKRIDTSDDPTLGAVHVLPLYSRLPTKQQLEVFKDVPENHRLIVVSTNVAETSVTIPGIRYVVDCGREKRKIHDQVSGTSKFEIGWVSQASANQRSGRAGRTGPGHCYRLYSSAVFNDQFAPFPRPEIDKLPIEDVILYMKTMGIGNVESFPFPSRPDVAAVRAAESRLIQLGALLQQDEKPGDENHDNVIITPLGRRIGQFPVRTRLAKMLAIVACDTNQSVERVAHVIAIVAAMSLQAPFLHMQVMEEGKKEDDVPKPTNEEEKEAAEALAKEKAQELHERWNEPSSDALSLLIAAGAYAHVVAFESNKKGEIFCKENLLHHKTMKEQLQLRGQLARLVARMRCQASIADQDSFAPDSDVDEVENEGEEDDELYSEASTTSRQRDLDRKHIASLSTRLRGPLSPLSDDDRLYIRQIVAAGYLDQVARKMTREEALALSDEVFTKKKKWPYRSCSPGVTTPLYIHQHSHLYQKDSSKLPEYVVYGYVDAVEKSKLSAPPPKPGDDSDESSEEEEEEEEEVAPKAIHYMKQVTKINPSWLFALAKGTNQCTLSRVLEQPPPTYDSTRDVLLGNIYPLFGPMRWKLPSQWLEFPANTQEDIHDRARWFGRALLEGKVLPSFQRIKDWLSVPPTYMSRKIHDPRVQDLMLALCIGPSTRTKKKKKKKSNLSQPSPVFSRSQLFTAWEKDPSYLFPQLQKWVKKEHRQDFSQIWESIHTDIF